MNTTLIPFTVCFNLIYLFVPLSLTIPKESQNLTRLTNAFVSLGELIPDTIIIDQWLSVCYMYSFIPNTVFYIN